jgi:hypothetical protein
LSSASTISTLRQLSTSKNETQKVVIDRAPLLITCGIDRGAPFCGEWSAGRIYQTRGGPDNLRWFWSMTRQRPDDAR